MRSLIILEVEHEETTDALEDIVWAALHAARVAGTVNGWSVRVDLPACFVLDSENTNKGV